MINQSVADTVSYNIHSVKRQQTRMDTRLHCTNGILCVQFRHGTTATRLGRRGLAG